MLHLRRSKCRLKPAIRNMYRSHLCSFITGMICFFLLTKYLFLNPWYFPPPGPFRQYHRCNYEAIPYVLDPFSTAQYLLFHPNSSFVRFGDSEILLMNNRSVVFQNNDPMLASKLYKSFSRDHKDFMIGIPDVLSGYPSFLAPHTNFWYNRDFIRQWLLKHAIPKKIYLNPHITGSYPVYENKCAPLSEIYSTLRQIWKDQDIVLLRGNNTQVYAHDIYDTAKSVTVIYAPRYQAWDDYTRLKEALLKEDPHKLFILTAGPVAKVLVLDLFEHGRRALDLGHLAKDYDTYLSNKPFGDFFTD